MRGLQRGVLRLALVGGEVDAAAGRRSRAERVSVLSVAEAGLVAAVGGVAGAEVAGQLGTCACVRPGGVFESVPEAAGADGL